MEKLSREKEKELILKSKNGDSFAMAEIYNYFKEELYHAAIKFLKNRDYSDDVVSDAFINFFKSIDKFDLRYPIRPWLYRIMRNEAASYMKKQGKTLQIDEEIFNFEFSEPSKEEEVFNIEEANYLRVALNKLSKEEKEILEYFYFESLSIKDISIVLSIPEGTVKSRLFNARNSLSGKINENK
jgi:RNA polymerase sigma-70 factor, ECF subfamily